LRRSCRRNTIRQTPTGNISITSTPSATNARRCLDFRNALLPTASAKTRQTTPRRRARMMASIT